MSAPDDHVRVELAMTRADAEALVAWFDANHMSLTTYTGEGIALLNTVRAVRAALGEGPPTA